MSNSAISPLVFEDIEVGQVWTSPSRAITEADVSNFAWLTGDFNRLHMDEEFASRTPFRRPIAHGLLGLSFVAGLGSESPLVDTSAFLGINDWKFLQPIYFGDTVYVKTEAIAKQPRGRRHGLVTWKRQLINQDNDVVQEGSFQTLVSLARRAALMRQQSSSEIQRPASSALS